MSSRTSQKQFMKAATFKSEYEWQCADSYIVHAIKTLALKNDDELLNLLKEMPSADKIETVPEEVLRAQLITTPIPAFVDKIAAQSGMSADLLLKPTLRTLRAVMYFDSIESPTLDEQLTLTKYMMKTGRDFFFANHSRPPESNWKRPDPWAWGGL